MIVASRTSDGQPQKGRACRVNHVVQFILTLHQCEADIRAFHDVHRACDEESCCRFHAEIIPCQLFVDKLVARAKESGARLSIAKDRNELASFVMAKLKVKSGKLPAKAKRKSYPAHWGSPPKRQTRDYRKLPGGYGFGSSTLAKWIQKNLDNDANKQKRIGK